MCEMLCEGRVANAVDVDLAEEGSRLRTTRVLVGSCLREVRDSEAPRVVAMTV